MKKSNMVLASLLMMVPAPSVFAMTGFVTPSEMTITFTELRLIKSDSKNLTLLSGTFPAVFRKTDSGFASVSLSSIVAPAGRFVGVNVCYNTARTVKINGDRYEGTTVGAYSSGTQIYSVGTDAVASGSVQTTAATATTMGNFVVGNGTNNCSASYFGRPVCVATDVSDCESGDSFVDAGTTVPNLNLLLDMYHAVGVDPATNSLDNHLPVYPYPTIGNPGAAIHYKANVSGNVGNITLLFGSDKKLLYSAAWGSGACSGNGFVTVSSAPAGAFMNSYGPTAVQDYSTTTGNVQFAAGNSGSGSTSVSNGMITIPNAIQGVASGAISVSCVADSAAVPPYLGFGYTSGAGAASVNFSVQRITDPSGIFATSTSCTGTCVRSGDTFYP